MLLAAFLEGRAVRARALIRTLFVYQIGFLPIMICSVSLFGISALAMAGPIGGLKADFSECGGKHPSGAGEIRKMVGAKLKSAPQADVMRGFFNELVGEHS